MDKIAIVTGGGTGIGRAVALSLVKMDYVIYLVGRRMALLEETQQLAQNNADKMRPFACDLTDDAAVAGLFAQIEAQHGRLDLLFNNAGTSAKAVAPDELPMDEWRKVMDINVTSVFNCARHAFQLMKKQQPIGGRIINNGSISAHMPRPFSAPYTASKHAVLGLTKSLSLDGRAFNICVGQIDIGNASTDMTGKMTSGILQPNGTIMSEPTINVQNIADAVCYMAAMPLDTNILSLNVMANQMPFVGRG